MLTVKEVAVLLNCSEQYIRAKCKSGKILAEKLPDEHNHPKYFIPLSTLETTQQRAYRKSKRQGEALQPPEPKLLKPLEEYTVSERQHIGFWSELIEEWQGHRFRSSSKLKADEDFVVYAGVAYGQKYQEAYGREFTLTTDTLYRRWRAFREQDYDGLIEKRGREKRGTTSVPDVAWDAFLSFYLDQSQHPLTKCYSYTKLWLQQKYPELVPVIPSYHAFYRRVQNEVPEPLKVLGREGEKAFVDRCAPYIKRTYDDMESNEYWIADTHTFDVMTQGEDGKPHRLYLVAFFDARSGIFTGCHIAEQPSSQATLVALRKGILKYGKPVFIYVDNGREFLTHDVGGLGHRKRKKKATDGFVDFDPPPVFQRLGITMINAQVRNARAKIIERRFRDVKDHLSRLFESYTGGNVLERPERLKAVLKRDEIPTDAEFIQQVEQLLDFYFNNQEYHGAVARDHGKSRIQVYYENLHTKRLAPVDDLNLMMMRSSRPQKVGRRGVHLRIAGQQIDYWNDELVSVMFGKQVYYRYDPDDLSSVRVYDVEDRFLMVVPADSEAVQRYGSSKEELDTAIKKIRKFERMQKEVLKNSGLDAYDRISALDLVLAEAKANSEAEQPASTAKVLQLDQVTETPLLEKAAGYDIDTMLRNAEKYHEGGTDHE